MSLKCEKKKMSTGRKKALSDVNGLLQFSDKVNLADRRRTSFSHPPSVYV